MKTWTTEEMGLSPTVETHPVSLRCRLGSHGICAIDPCQCACHTSGTEWVVDDDRKLPECSRCDDTGYDTRELALSSPVACPHGCPFPG